MTNDGIKSNSLSRLDRLKKTKLYSVSSYPNLLLQTYDDGVGGRSAALNGYATPGHKVMVNGGSPDGIGRYKESSSVGLQITTFRCA